jgi:hypothetical protein
VFADQVNGLGAEIFAQQDANLNAIAKASARNREQSNCPDAEAGGGGDRARVPPTASAGADEDPLEHGHHSDPMFMGGARNQPLTRMSALEHQELHSELNRFLRGQTDAFGRSMSPSRSNPGQFIRSNFSRSARLGAMRDFYRGPGARFSRAAADFFKQHPDL